MKNYKFVKLLLALLIITTVFLTGCANKAQVGITNQPDPQKTRVIMLDIGQGDSMLIQTHGKNILVDASKVDTRRQLLDKLKKYHVKELDLVISTHAHEDHIGGMDAVFQQIPIKEVLDPGVPSSSKLYYNYLSRIQEKKIKFTVPKVDQKIALAQNTYLEFYTPVKPLPKDKDNTNNTCLVFKLVDDKFTMLFTGDIEKSVENALIQKYAGQLQSDVLKSPHHGSSTSSTQKFLDNVHPKDVLISCGANNEYNHPHEAVVKRYQNNKINMYVTNKTGDIAVTASDNGYEITTSK